MDKKMLSILRCPKCHANRFQMNVQEQVQNEVIKGTLICLNCPTKYEVMDGIPILLSILSETYNKGKKEGNSVKCGQIKYFDEECDEEFETNRPHDTGRLYEYLIDYKFRKAIESLPVSIENCILLDVCCGSGMATEYYAKKGARVIGTDISFAAVRRAKKRGEKYNFKSEYVVADAENLPFQNDSFDFACVHDGFHHLEKPQSGVRELSRLAEKGFFLMEPAKAFLTKISTYLGVSTDYEDAGNFVYRFNKKELKKWAESLGYKRIMAVRYLMYYPHFPPKWFKLFGNKILFNIFLPLYNFVNVFCGFLGNKMLFVAWDKNKKRRETK